MARWDYFLLATHPFPLGIRRFFPRSGEIPGVGHLELGPHRFAEYPDDVRAPGVEVAVADGLRQRLLIGHAKLLEAGPVGSGLDWPQFELSLDHLEGIHGHPGVELHPSVGRFHHVALEELPHGLDELGCGWNVVRLGHAISSRRSHSFSHTRRPIAASSTDRTVPERWVKAWAMHITPHFSVPSTSHQRTTSGSTARPDARP